MRLYERFADKNYHTSIATTFGIDFDAYESIALSRLRGAGCRNNIVLSDRRMLTHALSGASSLPQRAGTSYTVSGADAQGVFHPKLFLQFGRRGGRLLLGSANLTPSGLAGNLEIAGSLVCDEADSGEQRLIAQGWQYASSFIKSDQQSTHDQITWMLARAPWLQTATPADGPVLLKDGRRAALLLSGEHLGIGRRFCDLIDDPVKRLIVISPYWDPELAALSYLADALNPKRVDVLVDPPTKKFPKVATSNISNLTLYARGSFQEGRFIHAKMIIAQTEQADHVLFGSANCTNAALGGAEFAGINAEACLYSELPSDSVFDALRLSDVLTDNQVVAPDELDNAEYEDEIPLNELDQKSHGTFEGRGDSLTWHTKSIQNADSCTITFLDRLGNPVQGELTPFIDPAKNKRRFLIQDIETPPVFARVTFANGKTSCPAIINWIDKLKFEMRERQSNRIQKLLYELEEDTEASLLLLEIMNEFEANELSQSTPKAPISIPRAGQDSDDAEDSNHRVLSYEEFIKGRRPRTTAQDHSYYSLGGSDVSIIPGVLNRIIGLGDVLSADLDATEINKQLGLGDETDDPEGAMNAGAEFSRPTQEQLDAEDARRLRKAKKRRATQKQLVDTVKQFQDNIKERVAQNEPLTNYDLVRLRALVMIIATAASPYAKLSDEYKEKASQVRVLPVEGDPNSWPMVLGRLLFTFFGGNNPAIKQLHLVKEHDQIPSDFNECWATCYWAFQACLSAPLSPKEKSQIERHLSSIAKTAFMLTLPSKDELLADNIMGVIERMSQSYAEPLNIDANSISKGYKDSITEMFRNPPSF